MRKLGILPPREGKGSKPINPRTDFVRAAIDQPFTRPPRCESKWPTKISSDTACWIDGFWVKSEEFNDPYPVRRG